VDASINGNESWLECEGPIWRAPAKGARGIVVVALSSPARSCRLGVFFFEGVGGGRFGFPLAGSARVRLGGAAARPYRGQDARRAQDSDPATLDA